MNQQTNDATHRRIVANSTPAPKQAITQGGIPGSGMLSLPAAPANAKANEAKSESKSDK